VAGEIVLTPELLRAKSFAIALGRPGAPAREAPTRQKGVRKGRRMSLDWYALRTRSRHEKRVREQLETHGIEPFLPLVERWRQWKDRRKQVAFPLFPGYCFARFPPSQRVTVLSTQGVVQILGNQEGPVAVPDAEIEAVRRLVESTLPYDPHPYLTEGMQVEVIRGPLAGLRGLLLRKGARARLVIGVALIHQGASVELDAFDVSPVS
jgi:transcription termination/antitermination protein NusG